MTLPDRYNYTDHQRIQLLKLILQILIFLCYHNGWYLIKTKYTNTFSRSLAREFRYDRSSIGWDRSDVTNTRKQKSLFILTLAEALSCSSAVFCLS